MTTPIQSLNLTRRATNCLLAEGMTTVEQVAAFTREHGMNGLLRIPNLGRKWANEVMAAVGVEHQTPKRRNDGGPAFPTPNPRAVHDCANAAIFGITDPQRRAKEYAKARAEAVGMSLRDYFAAKAMQGLLAQSCGTALGSDPIHGAQYAYQMADAMLAARKEKP